MDYDLDTKEGMNNAITWTRQMFIWPVVITAP